MLELTQHLERRPSNLSGGQRQRVAMGRAIVRSPKAFLMDEPLSNLDAKLRVQMRTQVSRIQKSLGTTTLYVTHDQTEAMTLGDRVVVMRGGVVQQVGAPSFLYAHPKNLFVAGFIGSPSMNFLPGQLRGGGTVVTALGEARLTDECRQAVERAKTSGNVILGIRPEHFEDAALVGDRSRGHTFRAKIDVLESMGSEYYAYFMVQSSGVSARELDELAQDAGGADLPRSPGGTQVIARLDAASRVRQGQEAELWVNAEHLQLFDAESGRSLLGRGAAREAVGSRGG
jgi:multiple sugar transport system ATP-binding protein